VDIQIQRLRPRIEALVDCLREALCERDSADLVPHLADPVAAVAVCELLDVPPGDRARLREWLPAMAARAPDVALRAEVGMPARLMREMVEGTVDIGVMYTPQLRPGLQVETLFEDELVLISVAPKATPQLDSSYVFIDWGPEFHAAHAFTYPDYSNPGVVLSLGALGLDFVLENGRSGYFPRRVAQSLLDRGRIHLVPGAPVFPFPAYVVYDTSLEADLLEIALEELRRVAMAVDGHLEDREILGSEPTRALAGAG